MDFESMFPDIRETGETNTRQCQLVMLRMLKILHFLCEKHHIRYFLLYGSLLGAVRHKGFIPWDDDMDIGMTRDDYEKFISKAVPELPNDIFFQNSITDKYYPASYMVEARLRDKYSKYTDNYKYHDGLQVDIFVFDKAYLPFQPLIVLENALLRLFRSDRIRPKILKKIASLSDRLVYSNSFYYKYYHLFLHLRIMREDDIFPLKKLQFEDTEIYVPNKYDKCLKEIFGDYMKLPPENERKGHHKILPDPFHPCNHKEILHWK